MNRPHPGDQVATLCQHATHSLLLVAPFIKAASLERLLGSVAATVAVQCVTRWRPDEIAAGVSDLAVWPLIAARPGATLWLRHDLHAKYYRADAQVLVGSANLTATALGWASQPNLELLIEVAASDPACAAFEASLWTGAIPADAELHQQMSVLVAGLPRPPALNPAPEHTSSTPNELACWLPRLRQPADLWLAYDGHSERLSNASRSAAAADLVVLAPPPGLTRASFEATIGALLLQMPLIHALDQQLRTPQRFGAIRDWLAATPCLYSADVDPARAWQTVMRWLEHFLPNRYQRLPSRHSEVLVRR
ncbi:MAG: phospholipase D family protein [Oscillochloridaceae bacterium umkhey_bin13]